MNRRTCFAVVAAAAIASLGGCATPPERDSIRALRALGFEAIELTGYELWACSGDDEFNTGFRAKNARKEPVSGVVCCGWVKSCTVRF